MIKKLLSYLFSLVFLQIALSQNNILYTGGIAHLGNGLKIENSAIGIENGKFSIVADANIIQIDPTNYDTIIKINKGQNKNS